MASPSLFDRASSPTSSIADSRGILDLDGGYKEWSSRIRATQADIDRDEELEQRRLRDEILAAREARRTRQAARELPSGFLSPPMSPSLDAAPPTFPNPTSSFASTTPRPLPSPRLGSPTRPDLSTGSLANRNDALSFSASFRPDPSSSSSSGGPVSLAHFMGARRDLKGPVLTKTRVNEDEVRPSGWEAAERRAAEARGQGTGGLAGFLRGGPVEGGRALPGMVNKSRLEAEERDRKARETAPSRPLSLAGPSRANTYAGDRSSALGLASTSTSTAQPSFDTTRSRSPTRSATLPPSPTRPSTSTVPSISTDAGRPTTPSRATGSYDPPPMSPNIFEMARSKSPLGTFTSGENVDAGLATPRSRPASPTKGFGGLDRSAAPVKEVARPAAPAKALERPASPIKAYERPASPIKTYERSASPTKTSSRPASPLKGYERPASPTKPAPEPRPVSPLKRASTIASSSVSSTPPAPSTSWPPRATGSPSPATRAAPSALPPGLVSPRAPTASLSRLAGSNIVQQRVQWSRDKEATSTPGGVTTPGASGTGTGKRSSVVDRWGRDEPSVVTTPKTGAATMAPTPLTPITKGRARGPQKTTPRTSTIAPSTSSDLLPSTSSPAPSSTVRDDPANERERSRLQKLAATWQAQGPIGQKSPSPALSSTRPLPTPPAKSRSLDTRVALPGMVPLKPTASTAAKDEKTLRTNKTIPLSPIGRLPYIDIASIMRPPPAPPKLDLGTSPSIEIFSVSGAAVAPVLQDRNVFYSTETLAIIFSSSRKGPAVVVWKGRENLAGSAAERKLSELAGKYGSKPAEVVLQGREPAELVSALGGTIVIRQGNRRIWTPSKTAIYRVGEVVDKAVVVEEVGLEGRNLVAGKSAVVSRQDRLWVWHGKRTSVRERQAAEAHAKLISDGRRVVVLEQGSESAGFIHGFIELFGADEIVNSNQWRHRAHVLPVPRLWVIDAKSKRPVLAADLADDAVSVVDTGLEIFVIVPPAVRHQRVNIALAVRTASAMSEHLRVTRARPFRVPAHVLVFPTVVPADFSAAARACDLQILNDGVEPVRMNLHSVAEAEEQLARTTVDASEIEDEHFLPLGVGPSVFAV